MSTGVVSSRRFTSMGNDGIGTYPRSNHWLDQTAGSFGWTVEAAAGQPLRSEA